MELETVFAGEGLHFPVVVVDVVYKDFVLFAEEGYCRDHGLGCDVGKVLDVSEDVVFELHAG